MLGDWFTGPDYWFAREAFQRGVAAIYLVGFLTAARQGLALLGEHGLTPIPAVVRRVPFRLAPSLFQFHYSDRMLMAVAWSGVAASAALVAGVGDLMPLWAATLLWAVPWILYLSIVNVGHVWYGFGWETLLLEAGFLAVFFGNERTGPPTLMFWLVRWLLFRVEFGAGLIKLRGDQCWRNLTCLRYHYETQPMPGPLSWFFHHLPDRVHRVEVAANHLAQLVAPVALFAPQPAAGAAAGFMIVTQLWLVLSGNFSWLNWLTIVLALPIAAGAFGSAIDPAPSPPPDAGPAWYQVLVLAVTALIVALSYRPARNLMLRRQLMNHSFDALRLVNTYGAFGRINRQRFEVVIEGTDDAGVTAETRWREYGFKGKPGDPRRLPRQFAPYHLRLDWMMWFVGVSPHYAEPWLRILLTKLLVNDVRTVRLLRTNPFPDPPPRYVRALLYRYEFTDWSELRRTGAWWRRDLFGEFARPVSLTPNEPSSAGRASAGPDAVTRR